MSSEIKEVSLEHTMDDDVWMDSFDKLLKTRPVLRGLNVIKKDVRASFNFDSSVENCSIDNCDTVDRVSQKQTLTARASKSISTPLTKINVLKPFTCSLSPIGVWQYRFFDNLHKNKNLSNVHFSHGTPNKPEVVVVDYDLLHPQEISPFRILEKNDLSLLPFPNKKTKENNRRVHFESNVGKTNFESSSSKYFRSSAPVLYQKSSRVSNNTIKPDKSKKAVSLGRSARNSKDRKLKSTKKAKTADEFVEFCVTSTQNGNIKSIHQNPEKGFERRSAVSINSNECQTVSTTNQLRNCRGIEGVDTEMLINQCGEPSRFSAENPLLQMPKKNKISFHPCPQKETKKKDKRRHASFEINLDELNVKSSSAKSLPSNVFVTRKNIQRLTNPTMKPGKWRKSLNVWRRTQYSQNGEPKSSNIYVIADESVEICNVSMRFYGERKSTYIKTESNTESLVTDDAKECEKRVLAWCQQRRPKQFDKLYKEDSLKNCRKIGEGAYGEVFINKSDNTDDTSSTVMKVIPIEGKIAVNGEVQKTFQQILPEIVISMELSNLDNVNNFNSTIGFIKINRVTCVKGKYPTHLVKLWEAYDEDNTSENDHPAIFTSTQLFIVLELAYGGQDLEKFEFTNAEQSYYMFEQLSMSLAVAEETFQFEHRDLHWGNILINKTTEKHFQYKLKDELVTLPSKGIKVSIIDYTLSRMTCGNCVYYNDMSKDDELFEATGDYQFDIYRMMKTELKNRWDVYKPKTNIFWLSYVITKLVNDVKYKNKRAKIHTSYIQKLKKLKESILNYDSVVGFASEFIIAK